MPEGTGEDDYALLLINGLESNTTLPYISPDIRHTITQTDDQALIVSYPASFIRGALIRTSLFQTSAIITIKDLLTFKTGAIDALSLGSSIVAQSGSSGGAIVNQWNKLIGIVVTASAGNTTSERNLRGLTLEHISRSMQKNSHITLETFLLKTSTEMTKFFADELSKELILLFKKIL